MITIYRWQSRRKCEDDAARAMILPLGVACWVIARIAFWIGYRVDQKWRTPGMAWTHVTTIIMIVWLVGFSL